MAKYENMKKDELIERREAEIEKRDKLREKVAKSEAIIKEYEAAIEEIEKNISHDWRMETEVTLSEVGRGFNSLNNMVKNLAEAAGVGIGDEEINAMFAKMISEAKEKQELKELEQMEQDEGEKEVI